MLSAVYIVDQLDGMYIECTTATFAFDFPLHGRFVLLVQEVLYLRLYLKLNFFFKIVQTYFSYNAFFKYSMLIVYDDFIAFLYWYISWSHSVLYLVSYIYYLMRLYSKSKSLHSYTILCKTRIEQRMWRGEPNSNLKWLLKFSFVENTSSDIRNTWRKFIHALWKY